MGFHTGKHGKVYNDDKKSHGSSGHSPGNNDGSTSSFMENIHKENELHADKEFPVVKWHGGEEYAVLHNKTGEESPYEITPIMDLPLDKLPKHIEFIRAFDSAEDAFDFQDFYFTHLYGGIGLINNKDYEKDCKKYGYDC